MKHDGGGWWATIAPMEWALCAKPNLCPSDSTCLQAGPPLVLTGLFHVLFSDVTLPWGAHQLLFNGWNSPTFEHPQSRIKPGEPVGCRRKDPRRWGAAIDSIGVKMLSTVGCPQPSHQGAAGKNRRQTRLPALFLPYVDLHSAFPKFYIWETLVFSPK